MLGYGSRVNLIQRAEPHLVIIRHGQLLKSQPRRDPYYRRLLVVALQVVYLKGKL